MIVTTVEYLSLSFTNITSYSWYDTDNQQLNINISLLNMKLES